MKRLLRLPAFQDMHYVCDLPRPLIRADYRPSVLKDEADAKVSREIAVYEQRARLQKETKGEAALADIISKARQLTDQKRAKKK